MIVGAVPAGYRRPERPFSRLARRARTASKGRRILNKHVPSKPGTTEPDKPRKTDVLGVAERIAKRGA
jgi:hypothetical protein